MPRIILPIILAGILSACAPVQPSSHDPATMGYHTAHATMMRNMDMAYTGNADVDFARGMIAHHQGAIDMANVERQYGHDPKMRRLATDIIAAQKKEIAQMQDYLKRTER